MFIADFKGKLSLSELNSEDFLTSSVFSVFRYLNEHWLEQYLQHAVNLEGGRLSLRLSSPVLDFWPWFSNKQSRAEPDLVIYSEETAVIIEAKNYAGKSGEGTLLEEEIEKEIIIDQLWREYYVGLNNILGTRYRDFYLLYLTRHPQIPADEIESTLQLFAKHEAPKARRRIFWLNWQKAVPILERIIAVYPENSFQVKISKDLLLFLERRNLGVFSGFKFLENYDVFPALSGVMFYKKIFIPYWDYLGSYSEIQCSETIFYKECNLSYWEFLSPAVLMVYDEETIFYRGLFK